PRRHLGAGAVPRPDPHRAVALRVRPRHGDAARDRHGGQRGAVFLAAPYRPHRRPQPGFDLPVHRACWQLCGQQGGDFGKRPAFPLAREGRPGPAATRSPTPTGTASRTSCRADPDNWLRRPNPWEVARPHEKVDVKLSCSFVVRTCVGSWPGVATFGLMAGCVRGQSLSPSECTQGTCVAIATPQVRYYGNALPRNCRNLRWDREFRHGRAWPGGAPTASAGASPALAGACGNPPDGSGAAWGAPTGGGPP